MDDLTDLLLLTGTATSRRPTPAQVRAVWGSFALSPAAGQNSPWQSYKYCAWDKEYRKKARDTWHQKGVTTVWISAIIHYQEASFDGRENAGTRQHVIDCINELLAESFIPFIQVGECWAYGIYDDAGIAEMKDDIAQYAEWGWQAAFDGLGIELWPESNDSTYGYQIVDIAKTLRPVLPNSFIGVHVGPYGDGLYQGDPYKDAHEFWHAIEPYVDALFWQGQSDWYEGPDWKTTFFTNVTGAVSRIQHEMDVNELTERCKAAGLGTPSKTMIDNLGHVIPSRKIQLVYWEGPQFTRPTDAFCDDAARLALYGGAIGTNAGIPSAPSIRLWSRERRRHP